MKRTALAIAMLVTVPAADATPLVRALHADIGMTRPNGAPPRWCAWYLDRKLKELGFQGLPSYRARDAVNYGRRAAGFVPGAIAVMRTHITVIDLRNKCPAGQFAGTGGNQGKRVKTSCYSKNKVISLREPVRAKPVITPTADRPARYVTNFKGSM